MFDHFSAFFHDPMVTLYAIQAVTYAFSAVVSRMAGHVELSSCYTMSSLIHALLAAVHLLHLG